MFKPIKRKQLLLFSILASLLLHGIEIHFLQRSAFWFSSPESSGAKLDPKTHSMSQKEKNQILKETFSSLSLGNGRAQFAKLSPIEQNAKISLVSSHPDFLSIGLVDDEISFPKKNLLSFIKTPSICPSFDEVKLKELPKKDLNISVMEEVAPPLNAEPLTITLALTQKLPKQTQLETPLSPLPWIPPVFSPPFRLNFSSSLNPKAPSLLKIPPLFEHRTTSYSSFFDTELLFLEEAEGSYLFALTLIPKENLKRDPFKQSYVFLIDKGNSIQKDRLYATKLAVKKAIEELSAEDSFNIVVFDQKIEKLSPTSLPVTSDSKEKAYAFLSKIELGNFFSQKNLYKPLFLTVPYAVKEGELYTAILITDGESLSNRAQMQSLTHDWTHLNQGKVSLYTLGIGEDSHTSILETLASLNRGKAITSPTNKGIKRKLLKLMKSTSSPLAKNITCQAIAKNFDEQTSIELYPNQNSAPHLFSNEPYVILGKTNSLDDFVLFVQGKLANEWLHIKKTISFANAKRATPALISQVAQSKSLALYQKYLEGAGAEYLAEANDISKTYELPRAFE